MTSSPPSMAADPSRSGATPRSSFVLDDWSHLNHLQVGRFSEYFAKMAFALHGFEVFTSEVDDRGIDFVIRRDPGFFYEVQVKSIRGHGYIFLPKSTAPLSEKRLVTAIVLHPAQEPSLYLLPMKAWQTPDALLVSRDYEGKKSAPEWGLNISGKNQHLLDAYRFAMIQATL